MNQNADLKSFLLEAYIGALEREYNIKLLVSADIFNVILLWYDENTICLYSITFKGQRTRIPVNPKWTFAQIKQCIFNTFR